MKKVQCRPLLVLFVLSALAGSAPSIALQRPPSGSDATVKAVAAAKAFLAMLNDEQRKTVNPELNKETRSKWSNLPNGVVPFHRNGIKLGDMTPAQQDAALKVVAAPLSESGFEKVINILNGDEVFAKGPGGARGGNGPTGPRRFGRGEFYFAILGAPSATAPWMIQFGGHHLGINITLVGGQHTIAPSHTGAQPATYSLNGRTIQPLGRETDKAFALINALNADQRKQAMLDYAMPDTVIGPGHDGEVIQPEGVRAATFTPSQQAMLLDLIQEWVSIINDVDAKAKMAEVKTKLADIYFAWNGPTTSGKAAYFRIQGPTVEIEYSPQCTVAPCDPQARTLEHIHTFYRDPTNDYGAKFIAQ